MSGEAVDIRALAPDDAEPDEAPVPEGHVRVTSEAVYYAALALNPHLERNDLKPVVQHRLGILAAMLEPIATSYERALDKLRRKHAIVDDADEVLLPRNAQGEPTTGVQIDPRKQDDFNRELAELEAVTHDLRWDPSLVKAEKLESTRKKAEPGIPHGARTLQRLAPFIDQSTYADATEED